MSTPSNPLQALIQRAYPIAQQAYKKWDNMPQAEKDRVLNDIKQRASQVVKTASERFNQAPPSTPPSTPKPSDDGDTDK